MRLTHTLTAAIGATALLVNACDRSESDRSASPVGQGRNDSDDTIATAEPTQPKAACVIPMSETPAPAARLAEECPVDPTGPYQLPRGWVVFPDAPGAPRVEVEVAATQDHRQRGLMYRTSMGEDEGMLFEWSGEGRRSFWMRNTCIPLDMLFVAGDRTIVGVVEQVPTLSDASRTVACPARYVVEVNAGWVRAHGVEPGQRIDIDT